MAHSTEAAFFYTSASKLAQKTLGDGPRLVRELFKLAGQNSPAIVFIDEIDAIGVRRSTTEHNEEREIQRTMLGDYFLMHKLHMTFQERNNQPTVLISVSKTQSENRNKIRAAQPTGRVRRPARSESVAGHQPGRSARPGTDTTRSN